MLSIVDLPVDVLGLIGNKLFKHDGPWRDERDVMRDYCALMMTAKAVHPIAEGFGFRKWPDLKSALAVTERSTIPRMRVALQDFKASMLPELSKADLRCSGRKDEVWERLRHAQERYVVRAFPRNPVLPHKRRTLMDWITVNTKMAKMTYGLNDKDIAGARPYYYEGLPFRGARVLKYFDVRQIRDIALARRA